jgi:hypothetical protein
MEGEINGEVTAVKGSFSAILQGINKVVEVILRDGQTEVLAENLRLHPTVAFAHRQVAVGTVTNDVEPDLLAQRIN